MNGERKMDEETIEIKPSAKYERHRRQIENSSQSNGQEGLFSDGCSKSDYKASIQQGLEELLLKHEENKLQYVRKAYEKHLLKIEEFRKIYAETDGMKELIRLRKIAADVKNNVTAQLQEQWMNANITVNERKKLLNETRENGTNSELEEKLLLVQITARNAELLNLQNKYTVIKTQKEQAELMEMSNNSKAATCESLISYSGSFNATNILKVKKDQLDREENKINDIWQKKSDLKNCCQNGGCL